MTPDELLRERALAFIAEQASSNVALSVQAVGYTRLVPFFRGVRGITAADAAALTAFLDANEVTP